MERIAGRIYSLHPAIRSIRNNPFPREGGLSGILNGLNIHLLGTPQIELDGKPVETERRKAIALLVYLLVEGGSPRRESLAALFWPDYDQPAALAYLRRTLWELNRMLGEGWLEIGRESLSLAQPEAVWVDVLRFRELAQQWKGNPSQDSETTRQLLEEAAVLYQGDFLAGFTLRDSPGFDEWQAFQSDSLRRGCAEILQALADLYASRQEFEAAIASARRRLTFDLLDETAQRDLMKLYAQAGQRSTALRQYEACAALLKTELKAFPSAETTSLYRSIKDGRYPEKPPAQPEALSPPDKSLLQTAEPTPISPDSCPLPHVHLPQPSTPFVGREKELAEIADLFAQPECRLLTLTGPGGMGKTRLAVQAAGWQADAFCNGIYFVPLASLSSPDFIMQAIAQALHFEFSQERDPTLSKRQPREQLLDYLREKQILLVLDNFEHLISGAEILPEILAAAPQVRLLATSRERLNLAEEWVYELHGLSYPSDGNQENLEAYGAVKLFLQIARRARSNSSLDEIGRSCISRITRLVEGMPLGIELAAAWVRSLACRELLKEIEHNLDILSTSLRGTPERHRSLRAVFEHSWSLLSPAERSVFQQLSVFQGGFQRQAASQVAGASLDLLTTLVDKSMLRVDSAGRYDLHEVLKQYASEKLAQDPEEMDATHSRHCAYYLELSLELSEQSRGPGQKEALSQLNIETENIRSAWRWALKKEDIEWMYRAAPALALHYIMGTRTPQEIDHFIRLVDGLRELQSKYPQDTRIPALLALFLVMQSIFYRDEERRIEQYRTYQESLELASSLPVDMVTALALALDLFGAEVFDKNRVKEVYQTCLQAARQSGDRWAEALIILQRGIVAQYYEEDFENARKYQMQAIAIMRELGDRWGTANAYQNMAYRALWKGDYLEARQLGEESLALYQELENQWSVLSTNLHLGQVDTALGAYQEAKEHYQTCLELLEITGNRFITCTALDCLGYLEYVLGEYDQAEAHHLRSLELYRQVNNRRGYGMALNNLGDVLRARHDLLGARLRYQEALQVAQEVNDLWGMTMSLKNLGRVCTAEGDHDQAAEYYHWALLTGLESERGSEVNEVLLGMAEVHQAQGQVEPAIQLLALVASHPGTMQATRELAAQRLKELEKELSPVAYAQAIEQGKKMKPEDWLEE